MSIRLCCFAALIALALSTRAETTTWADALSGQAAPLSITMKDLTADWQQMHVSTQHVGVEGQLIAMARAQSGGADFGLYYTKGQVLVIDGDSFLVSYNAVLDLKKISAMVKHGTEVGAIFVLTPDTPLALTLLNLRTCGNFLDIRPFDATGFRQLERRVNEATLRANLHQLRSAVEQFNADTGAYPLRLSDLLLPKHQAPKQGISERGASITIPANAYMGPYLSRRGGIAEAPGIPCNPFVDLTAANLDPNNVATHWKYVNGVVTVPDAMANEKTVDEGCTYGEL